MNKKTLSALSAAVCMLIMVFMACGGSSKRTPSASDISREKATAQQTKGPVRYGYKIINVYPHSTDSYTQGLYWEDGYLWEGTGQYGKSALMKVELETGKIVKQHELSRFYFGEGIASLEGNIYQLTWTTGKGFVYDKETFDVKGEFFYEGEGWGLTTDGSLLYMSDGTNEIRMIDPEGFKVITTFPVRMGSRRVMSLNELEWIEGRIWANVYGTDTIVIIDPETGSVDGVIDLDGLLKPTDKGVETDVLNGIAYDPEQKRIFVTGKNWGKLFEIELIEK